MNDTTITQYSTINTVHCLFHIGTVRYQSQSCMHTAPYNTFPFKCAVFPPWWEIYGLCGPYATISNHLILPTINFPSQKTAHLNRNEIQTTISLFMGCIKLKRRCNLIATKWYQSNNWILHHISRKVINMKFVSCSITYQSWEGARISSYIIDISPFRDSYKVSSQYLVIHNSPPVYWSRWAANWAWDGASSPKCSAWGQRTSAPLGIPGAPPGTRERR